MGEKAMDTVIGETPHSSLCFFIIMATHSKMGARTTNTASETKAFRGGTVAPSVSVQRCVAPHHALHQNELRPSDVSSARITPCTCASCDGASSQVPLGPGATGGNVAPRPSQMHRRSVPGIIWHSRPDSTCRTSMKRESKIRMYGGCHATCSAVPSHSMVPLVRLGSPWRFTYNPNSMRCQ